MIYGVQIYCTPVFDKLQFIGEFFVSFSFHQRKEKNEKKAPLRGRDATKLEIVYN
jgi:hypothetical protein